MEFDKKGIQDLSIIVLCRIKETLLQNGYSGKREKSIFLENNVKKS